MDYKKMWEHHLKLASTYLMLAKKYEYISPQIHFQNYIQHLQHANEMERYFMLMQQRTPYKKHSSYPMATEESAQ
ncbi:hypothetical protein [Salinithrix halophila]|uniref:Spore coat protein n=1 Tax=Salinithrix halophila TaxID=1485204 RepID=A0ABV8JAS2_9BACL